MLAPEIHPRTAMPPKIDENPAGRVQIVAPSSWLQRIEEWRRGQERIPSLSAAIRRLVEIGLEAEKRERKPGGQKTGVK